MIHNKRLRLSRLSLGLIAALAAAPAFAQTTTSGVGGVVLSEVGTPVAGANVTIVHVESGTVSRTTTDTSGRYTARGLRVGGPYTITITKAGEGTTIEDDVYLTLNQVGQVNAQLTGDLTTLDTVTAVAVGGSDVFSANSMGAGTSVRRETIEALPSAGGNIQDYMRLDPRVAQISKADNSISAGGQNPRYNAIRVDGVSMSDSFGLEANNLPTRRQPVAMEALEAINIDLSSYDVTITGATGAVVDAVTKSGTNQFSGSVYGAYRDSSWFGDDPFGVEFNGFDKEQTYGVTFGGPIVRDRLFFFANYEKQEWKAPGASISDSALGNGLITEQEVAEAASISSSVWGFDAGSYGDADATTSLEEYAVKLDWNITDSHRASLRYSNVEQSTLRTNGFFSDSISLSSYWYQHEKTVESWVGQLFSDWTDIFSTEFKFSYTDFAAVRVRPTDAPSVRIRFGGDENAPSGASIYLGTETNTQQNELYTETVSAYGAGILTLGNHDLKFGVDYTTSDIYNIYGPQLFGVYTFYGLDNYRAGRWSIYDLRTPQPGQGFESVAAAYEYSKLGFFIQDTWYATPNLTLTLGVRADKPDTNIVPTYNAAAQAAFGYDNSHVLGKDSYLWQPRFGFNYTFDTERQTQLRGGLGLFQGSSPQVWIGNAFNTTGFNYIQYNGVITGDVGPDDVPFSPDGYNQVPPATGTGSGGVMNVNITSPDFEQPSVWKANLAFDHELPWHGLVASAELLLTRVKSALYYQNLNLGDPTLYGQDGRPLLWNPANVGRSWTTANNRYNRDREFDAVYLLDSTDKGSTQQFTISLEKPFSTTSDWSWNVGYTYTQATEVSGLTSSTASSGWNNNYIFEINEEVAARSRYEIRDRFTASLNWQRALFGNYRTSVGVFYEGRSGRPFSYVYTNDVNGDARSFQDLFYVPSGPGDVLFGTLSGTGVFTSNPQMEAAFFEWLSNTPELGRYAGSVVDRNSGRADWVNSFDVRISQELPGFFSGHKSEIWLDIMNIGNLINSDWGHIIDYGFNANLGVLSSPGIYDGKYVYNFTNPSSPTVANNNGDGVNVGVSQWSVQLGFRYKF